MAKPTAVETLEEMSQGQLLLKLEAVMKKVTAGLLTREKSKGKVSLTLEYERNGSSDSIQIKHKLAYSVPTLTGTLSEDSVDVTSFIGGVDGTLYISSRDRDEEEARALSHKSTSGLVTQ